MSLSFVLAMLAFGHALLHPERVFLNFPWMQFGSEWVRLGWMLDPLAAVMMVMVTFVGLLIFIYSVATCTTTKTLPASFASSPCLPGQCSAC